ncbi:MAG: CPBP family intramembrane metalloprotease [Spirochaetaceae bacterium]|nr:MAG: CPBP family intramembrane metalloprotease [Spirochaetaceae bacterium]
MHASVYRRNYRRGCRRHLGSRSIGADWEVLVFLPIIVDTIVLSLITAVAVLPAKRNRRPNFALLFLVVYAVSRIVTRLPSPDALGLHPEGLAYNWVGHLFIIAWVLIFVRIGPLRAKDIGLTLAQRPGTVFPAVLVTLGVIAFKSGLAVLLSGGPPDDLMTETLLFQITMPALAQELVYSGILLSLMLGALGGKKVEQEFDWTVPVVLAVIVTALSHGITFGLRFDSGLQFDIAAFSVPFLGKLVYAWLRLSTGSLVFPVLAYSLSNLAVLLLPYLLI